MYQCLLYLQTRTRAQECWLTLHEVKDRFRRSVVQSVIALAVKGDLERNASGSRPRAISPLYVNRTCGQSHS